MDVDTNQSSEIKNLTELLEKSLKRKVISYSLKYLTKPGDNYGSVMQALSVVAAGKNGSIDAEVLNFVAKSSVVNPYLIEIFQPELTFVKENRFYSDIIPAIKSFEETSHVPEEERIDAFMDCVGSRISLKPDATVADADAVLILENVKLQNFVNENRLTGFDTAKTLTILKSLAQFHALFVAMRRLQPKLFSDKVDPYITAVNLIPDENDTQMSDKICEELKYVDGLDSKLRTKIEEQIRICDRFARNTSRATDTPYTTVVHRDLWTNNVMVLKDAEDKALKIKFYDFQLYFYQTFVCDLIFFLLTSVHIDDLAENFSRFIKHYQQQFVNTLKSVNCPLNDYTFEKMWAEIRDKAKLEMLHVLFMTKICLADESSTPDLDDISPDTFFDDQPPSAEILHRWKIVIQLFEQNGFI